MDRRGKFTQGKWMTNKNPLTMLPGKKKKKSYELNNEMLSIILDEFLPLGASSSSSPHRSCHVLLLQSGPGTTEESSGWLACSHWATAPRLSSWQLLSSQEPKVRRGPSTQPELLGREGKSCSLHYGVWPQGSTETPRNLERQCPHGQSFSIYPINASWGHQSIVHALDTVGQTKSSQCSSYSSKWNMNETTDLN